MILRSTNDKKYKILDLEDIAYSTKLQLAEWLTSYVSNKTRVDDNFSTIASLYKSIIISSRRKRKWLLACVKTRVHLKLAD